MIRFSAFVISACILAACSGNPFDRSEDTAPVEPAPPAEPAPSPEPTPPTDPDGIEGRGLPPGTSNPTPDNSIVRREARGAADSANQGDGYANNFRYDQTNDTFYVEGLAFDGNQPGGAEYSRSPVPLGSGFAAYEGPSTVQDSLTGVPIEQLVHRVVFKRGETGPDGTPLTELAIVRTGSYSNYGFGGFIYQRNGNVVLPSQGQAQYSGNYAGLRDFNGVGGIEYVTGDTSIAIDFNGFSGNCTASRCTDAVRGSVSNRRVYNMNGTDITSAVVGAINTEDNATLTELPVLTFRIGTGVLDRNGEIVGTLNSNFVNNEGRVVAYENGNYYAIMAGDHTANPGGEIVGIVVVEGENRSAPGTGFRETGGFIATRQQPVGP